MSKVRAANGSTTNGHVANSSSTGHSKKNDDHKEASQTLTQADVQISYSSFAILGLVFLGSLAFLYGIYLTFPDLEQDEKAFIKLPRNMADAKNLGYVLQKYNSNHYYSVLAAFFSAYVFLQMFAIPGSIFLSILSGFLYPFPMALSLVCSCSALGALFCYLLSFLVGRRVVLKYLANKIGPWQQQVKNQKNNLLYYIIFLRITPFVPNWFINLASPLIDIPALPFILGTFIGVAPPSCVYISAGTTLHTLTSSTDVFSWGSVSMLIGFSILSLLPVWFKDTLRRKLE